MIPTFGFITSGVATLVVCTLGITGNMISFVVLSHPRMKSSMTCCLQNLAVYDTLLLLAKILTTGIPNTADHIIGMDIAKRLIDPYRPWFKLLFYIGRTGSIWTTITVSVERYIAVCYPLKARSWCTYRRSLFFNIFIALLVVACNIPRFFEYQMVKKFPKRRNMTCLVQVLTKFGKGKIFTETYSFWLNAIMTRVIPFPTLIFLNFSIYREIRKALKARRRMTLQEQEDVHLAKMLFCVVIVFFFSYVSFTIAATIRDDTKFGKQDRKKVLKFFRLMMAVNSAVNCIIYYALARNFRETFRHIFCRRP